MKTTINEFLRQNLSQLADIISKLNPEFNSHDFLKKFAKKFESDYVKFLNNYKENSPFQTVHSQIALFLSENAEDLNICKTKKVPSETVFGEIDEIQGWKKCLPKPPSNP